MDAAFVLAEPAVVKVGSPIQELQITWDLVGNAGAWAADLLTLTLWEWGPAICVLTRLSCDPAAPLSLKTTDNLIKLLKPQRDAKPFSFGFPQNVASPLST